MRRLPRDWCVFCCALFLLAACSSDRGPTDVQPPPSNPSNPSNPSTPSDSSTPPPAEWTPLIGRTFTVSKGATNTHKCTAFQADSDLYITAFRLQAPENSFHTLVTVSDAPFDATGDFDCTAASGMGIVSPARLIYAAGIGTDDYLFPSGTGIHVKAGQYVQLNVAGQNLTGTADVVDTTQVLVRAGQASNVATEAEMLFVGTFNINLPSDSQPHTATGGCVQPADQHLLAILPTMNRLAIRQQLIVNHLGTPTFLLDTTFTVIHQQFYPVDDSVYDGDQVQLVATYVNNTGSTVMFGDSFTAEWAFVALYLTPVTGRTPFACTA